MGFPGAINDKEPTSQCRLDVRDIVSITRSGKSHGEEQGNSLQYSCLENPGDGGAWWAAVYGVTQTQTRLKRLSSVYMLSCIQLFVTLWTVALPASLSMGFYRQEYWSGWPFLPPGDLPDQGSCLFFVSCIGRCILHQGATWEAHSS